METKTRVVDTATLFPTEEDQRFLLDDAIESGDPGYIAHALGTIARAKGGLSLLERRTNIKRQTLNKALGKAGNPTLETLLPVLKALGLRLRIETAPADQREMAEA